MLKNHVCPFAGDDGRDNLSKTFMQSFLAYVRPSSQTVSAQSANSYNRKTKSINDTGHSGGMYSVYPPAE